MSEPMHGMNGMMWSMGLFGLLPFAVPALAVAALVKSLFFDRGRGKGNN